MLFVCVNLKLNLLVTMFDAVCLHSNVYGNVFIGWAPGAPIWMDGSGVRAVHAPSGAPDGNADTALIAAMATMIWMHCMMRRKCLACKRT